MNLNKNTAAYKIYAACYIMSKKLFGAKEYSLLDGDELKVPSNTNLCSLMRTVLIWSPVYILLLLAAVAGVGYATFYLPFLYGGIMGYVNSYFIPGAIIASIIGAGYLYFHARENIHLETVDEKEARHEAGNYTLWETFMKWVKSLHDKTCPLITIVDEPATSVTPVVGDTATPSLTTEVETNDSVKSDVHEENSAPLPQQPTNETEPKTRDKVKVGKINKFLAKRLPEGEWFLVAAICICVLYLVNMAMAHIMETETVVFERAACTSTFSTEDKTGEVICGEHKKSVSGVDFVVDTMLLKKKPYCEVKEGTYTNDMTFNCEYK